MSIIREENTLSDQVQSGVIAIDNPDVRDNINSLLMRTTNGKFLTPYIGFVKVAKVLANFHIFLEQKGFMEGEIGMVVIPTNQFGDKFGMRNDGSVVSTDDSPYSVFFEWQSSDCGMFEIFCQLVDEEELDEILVDVEAESNDETEEGEMNEETLNELKTKTYQNFIKKARQNKKNMDTALKSGHESPVLTSHSERLGNSIDRAKRLIAKKQSSEKLEESNKENKAKKIAAIMKAAGKKPEAATNGRAISSIRKAAKGPVVNDFDIRKLKIAEEENLQELTGKGQLGNIIKKHMADRNQKAKDGDKAGAEASNKRANHALGLGSFQAARTAARSVFPNLKMKFNVTKGRKTKKET